MSYIKQKFLDTQQSGKHSPGQEKTDPATTQTTEGGATALKTGSTSTCTVGGSKGDGTRHEQTAERGAQRPLWKGEPEALMGDSCCTGLRGRVNTTKEEIDSLEDLATEVKQDEAKKPNRPKVYDFCASNDIIKSERTTDE